MKNQKRIIIFAYNAKRFFAWIMDAKKHAKEQPNHKLININNLDNSCLEHSTSFSKYCKDCKKYMCKMPKRNSQ